MFDEAEVERYHALTGSLAPEDEAALRADLAGVFEFRAGMDVLDAGAGTGTMCRVLAAIPGLSLTALEPAPAMLARLVADPALRDVVVVEGFCDGPEDRGRFPEGRFDVVVSRQLANGLYDPLEAFSNWRHWLRPGGAVVLIDGVYDRPDSPGPWADEVDVLPMSACRTIALAPYLLERAGLRVSAVAWMEATNARPVTRTPRYVAVAHRDE